MMPPPTPAISLRSLKDWLDPKGLNLIGATTADDFDRSQPCGRRTREVLPSCGSIVVVASGGPEFWRHMRTEIGAQASVTSYAPIADRCSRLSREVCAWLDGRGVRARVVCPARNPNLNFAQMAEMAGLGVVSPVADWLMHPHFGPWVSVRFALLLEGTPLGASFRRCIAGEYQPCDGCDRPCLGACPAHVCASGSFDTQTCQSHREGGGCAAGCGMKMACPRGSHHSYHEDDERLRRAMIELSSSARTSGWWKLVPRAMRRDV
ncbi:MAG: hypothetical protein R3F56_26140 [Planctomycetota bacterium]